MLAWAWVVHRVIVQQQRLASTPKLDFNRIGIGQSSALSLCYYRHTIPTFSPIVASATDYIMAASVPTAR